MRRFTAGGTFVVAFASGLVAASPPAANAHHAAGPSRAAATGAGTYHPLDATRLLDTRVRVGAVTPGPRGTVHLAVTGRGGVPRTGVSAVALTVTAVAPTSPGFVTVYADGGARPAASNLNLIPGRTVPNLVVAPVNPATGKVALYNGSAGATPLLADVSGYYLAGTPTLAGSFRSLAPARLLDTRVGNGASTPAARSTVTVQIAGRGGVPASGASAVILNLTVASATGGGYVTAYDSGQSRPTTSNANFSRGQTVANMVVVALGTGGKVSIFNGATGATPLIADVAGYVMAGVASAPGTLKLVPPQRVLDTRRTVGASRPGPRAVTVVGPNGLRDAPIRRLGADMSAVVMNTTVPNASADGHITVGRAEDGDDVRPPNVSNLNFVRGQTASNMVFAAVNRRNDFFLYNGSSSANDLLGDIAGYYVSERGSVRGTVTDASTGAPIAGVHVRADGQEAGFGGQATTDSNGKYEIDDLYPLFGDYGSYRLCFDGADVPATSGYVYDCPTSALEVFAGETETVDDALTPGVAISGTVTAGTADPSRLTFLAVRVFDSNGDDVAAQSDTRGRYRAAGLPAGTYTVCTFGAYVTGNPQDAYGGQCYQGKPWDGSIDLPAGTTPVTVAAGDERPGIDFPLTSQPR